MTVARRVALAAGSATIWPRSPREEIARQDLADRKPCCPRICLQTPPKTAAEYNSRPLHAMQTISARDLKAIALVLDAESPDLSHHINSVTRRGPLPCGPLLPGDPIHHSYEVDLRAEDAEAILEALLAAERKYGGGHQVFGVSMAGMTLIWRGKAARIRGQIE